MRLQEARNTVRAHRLGPCPLAEAARWSKWDSHGSSSLTLDGGASVTIHREYSRMRSTIGRPIRSVHYAVIYRDADGETIQRKEGVQGDLRRLRRVAEKKLRKLSESVLAEGMPRLVRKSAAEGGTHPEARQVGNEIRLFPKFDLLPTSSQRHVLAHELGHWFRQEHVSLSDIMGWEPGEKYHSAFATFDSEEGFAEAFAVYLTSPRELRSKRPDLYADMKTRLRGHEAKLKAWHYGHTR